MPLLLPLAAQGNAWEISLTAVLPASHIDVWAPLVVAAVLLLNGMALANRRRTADAGFDRIHGVQRLDPMLVEEWADTVTESRSVARLT
ncbi:MAG TPA: hypothetical protein VFP63_05650 [Dehalococcoidia bacterium]|nr:hypothetical protein [Dehalococcoidia bacterium]